MSYTLVFSKEFEKTFEKLKQRNPKQAEIIVKKLREIKENPLHFKPLSKNLKGYRRVHIDSSFVLLYIITEQTIKIVDFDHHDNIYEQPNR